MTLRSLRTKMEFEELLKKNQDEVVVVFFHTSWCPPCRRIALELPKIQSDSEVVMAKVDCDEVSELAEQFEISSIPTFVLFQNGKEVQRTIGASTQDLIAKIQSAKETDAP